MAINKKLLKDAIELTNAYGISGREHRVSELIKKLTKNIKGLEYDFDNLGSLAIIKKGKNPKAPTISISTHMDEVGFMVTKIEKNGFLKFSPIGGWWGHVVLGQRLTVLSTDGKEYVGVVGSTPPHILNAQQRSKVVEIKNMFIDLGFDSKEKVEKHNIRIGSEVVLTSQTIQMSNPDFILGKAMDNRVSVAAGIEILRQLEKVDHDSTFILIATTQEEVGLRGARTSSYKWTTDIAFALDTTIANDTPGMEERDTKLTTGVALSIFDSSVIANEKLFNYVEDIAKKAKVKYTFDSLTGGGTDSGIIHLTKEGILNMTLSIPVRYMHSHNSIAAISDMQEAANLIVEIIKQTDNKKLNSLKFK